MTDSIEAFAEDSRPMTDGMSEMTDKDYIRAAVDLIGWFFTFVGEHECVSSPVSTPDGESPITFIGATTEQHVLDAIAAELVRQVDSTDYGITFDGEMCEVSVWGSEKFTPIVKSSSYGPDRTMNTIKVVVDSGVLL